VKNDGKKGEAESQTQILLLQEQIEEAHSQNKEVNYKIQEVLSQIRENRSKIEVAVC
jgi:peptidoglycan hydrolase CwlO-like protein